MLKEYADFVVVASGVVEIVLAAALLLLWKYRVVVGWAVAAFFVAIFPGNISQYVNGIDAFGLDSDALLVRAPLAAIGSSDTRLIFFTPYAHIVHFVDLYRRG